MIKITDKKKSSKATTTKEKVSPKTKKSKTVVSKKTLTAEEFLYLENEKSLSDLILKEFDKEVLAKCLIYIKSFSKKEDAIITTKDFIEYIESIDEDLHKYLVKYSSYESESSSNKEDDSEEEEKAPTVKSDDPVRMYLKEMGTDSITSPHRSAFSLSHSSSLTRMLA